MINILRRCPWQVQFFAQHTYKVLRDPGYRHQVSELTRLMGIPHYTVCTTDLFPFPFKIANAGSFVHLYQDIFGEEPYKFNTVSDTPRIVDCGSNIGVSILYFKNLYPNSRIVGFEPDPHLFGILEENVRNSGARDVELVNAAVWDVAGELPFLSEGGDSGRVSQEGDPVLQTVKAVRLRDYLTETIDLLKIDIEGAETTVLLDCKDCLHRVANIFVEYHSFPGQPQTLATIISMLSAAGFKLYVDAEMKQQSPMAKIKTSFGMDGALRISGWRE